ncbi:hypothetical protein CLOM621_09035 [Clostridium sp. M62/1]|nr:hypothetical protein CLOM621_09035 [Clostridium sp. M62/1]
MYCCYYWIKKPFLFQTNTLFCHYNTGFPDVKRPEKPGCLFLLARMCGFR